MVVEAAAGMVAAGMVAEGMVAEVIRPTEATTTPIPKPVVATVDPHLLPMVVTTTPIRRQTPSSGIVNPILHLSLRVGTDLATLAHSKGNHGTGTTSR
jgi:hypothetical protein